LTNTVTGMARRRTSDPASCRSNQGEGLGEQDAGTRGASLSVRPRTRGESDIDVSIGQPRMPHQRLAKKTVLPAVLDQHGVVHASRRFGQVES
jgi:hypothetical protein